ncbi:hypothetical protein [Vibrio astriarenae]|uniref:hypothetical protein n=1 Tax=Vibrio astriarenae TaxID=1481923 RepID=UPI0037354777
MKITIICTALVASFSANAAIHDPVTANGDLVFSEEIPTICGVRVTKSVGSIAFQGEEVGIASEQATKVIAYNNGVSGLTTFNVQTLETNLDPAKIKYFINSNIVRPNNNVKISSGLQGDYTDVIAVYDGHKSEVHAGKAAISATIEYSCE